MSIRRNARLRCGATAVVLFLAGGANVTFGQMKPAALAAERDRATYRGGTVTPPLAKPEFTLTDTAGAPFDFRRETEGYLTLLFFGYTHCPDECPMQMARVAMGLRTLPADLREQVKVVFVTTDPRRDPAGVIRSWLDHFDSRFIGLTGSESAIEAAQKAAGMPPARKAARTAEHYAITHANVVIAYTKDDMAHVIYPGGVKPQDWSHDLPHLIKETWSRR